MNKTIFLAAALCLQGLPGSAQEEREIVAGPEYSASGFKEIWFGSGYRDLWTAPIKAPVLDLASQAGGLTPVRQVGQAQSLGLALRGGDGRAYTFRLLKKEPERMMPEMWRKSWPGKIARDQTSGTHPGAGLMLPKLGEAADVAWVKPTLFIMPDDPALGQFRETFANQLGTLAEFPLPVGHGNPGFMDATEIISTSNLWKGWLEGPENRVDSRSLLRARILDLWVDNFDRHRGQWRWMKIPGQSLYQPLPEDADMVLVHHDGQLMNSLRNTIPRLLNFSGRYSRRLEGPLINSFEVDRWLLSGLERSDWESAAKDLQGRFTDEVIDQAMRDLPKEWYDLRGAWAATALQERRAGLVDYVLRVYDYYARDVDIHATDQAEQISVSRGGDNDLEISITAPGGSEPWYQRRFQAAETREIRLYLHGGDDRVVRTGAAGGPIKLRVIAGGGANLVDDAASGGTDVWTDAGTVEVKAGRGTRVRADSWTNPAPVEDAPWIEPRSFGHWTTRAPILAWHSDIHLLLGYRFQRTAWGFRTDPAQSVQSFGAAFAPTDRNGKVEYFGSFRRPMSSTRFELQAYASAIERINFFGFGNESPLVIDREIYRTRQNVILVQPTFRFGGRGAASIFIGPELRYSKAPTNVNSILEQTSPTGSGSFGRFAARAGLTLNSSRLREHKAINFADGISDAAGAPEELTGVKFEAETFVVPKAWDAKTGYQGLDASAVGYLGNSRHHLAVRAGGRKLWGDYAWFDAATVGGSLDRGFRSHRFYGDSSLYGTVSGRVMLGDLMGFPVVPLRVGVVGFVDNGRVWLKGETSKTWHTTVGGGLLVQPVGMPMTLHGIIAHSKEGNRYSFAFGYPF